MALLLTQRAVKCVLQVSTLIHTCTVMSKEDLDAFFAPPSCVRGLTVLDSGKFVRDIPLPAVKLADPSLCSKFMKHLSHVILKYPYLKKVVTVSSEEGKESKVLLLLPEQLRPHPLSATDHEWIRANGGVEVTHSVRMSYPDSYSHSALLKAILPAHIREVPSGFETVGHIAHFNLNAEVMPYKSIIGQVTLDKHKLITTVVNKTDKIDNTFRFFSMELLAGEDDMVATLSENGCSFTFDFSQVYWNSRLHSEHERVVALLEPADTVLDVFAGVGPFALPAAKKGCIVYANDLNPHSFHCLRENARKNKVDKLVHAYNLDGREFIRQVTKELVAAVVNGQGSLYTHVLMNLPASAHEFLDTFSGLLSDIPESIRSSLPLPTVHCYVFTKCPDSPERDSLATVTRSLGVAELEGGTYSVSLVRKVAPNKTMTRVSFTLPGRVAYAGREEQARSSDTCEPLPKRTKLE